MQTHIGNLRIVSYEENDIGIDIDKKREMTVLLCFVLFKGLRNRDKLNQSQLACV